VENVTILPGTDNAHNNSIRSYRQTVLIRCNYPACPLTYTQAPKHQGLLRESYPNWNRGMIPSEIKHGNHWSNSCPQNQCEAIPHRDPSNCYNVIIEIIHELQKNGMQDIFLNRKMKCTQSSGKN